MYWYICMVFGLGILRGDERNNETIPQYVGIMILFINSQDKTNLEDNEILINCPYHVFFSLFLPWRQWDTDCSPRSCLDHVVSASRALTPKDSVPEKLCHRIFYRHHQKLNHRPTISHIEYRLQTSSGIGHCCQKKLRHFYPVRTLKV